MMQSSIQSKLSREQCLNESLALMKNGLSQRIEFQIEKILPTFSHALDSNFDSLSTQLEQFKNEIIEAIN